MISTDFAPDDTELDAMEMDLLAADCDIVIPEDVEVAEAATGIRGLEVRGVGLTIERGRTLLDDVSFSAQPGTLTAVIGPSGAGKSTLAKVMAGAMRPTRGAVSFEGHDIHGAYAALRSRIGMVPQDDVVHCRLTVQQALGYAAELRLPPDTGKEDRDLVAAQVLAELEMTDHTQTRVHNLSGGSANAHRWRWSC